jgi:hypothetical protein
MAVLGRFSTTMLAITAAASFAVSAQAVVALPPVVVVPVITIVPVSATGSSSFNGYADSNAIDQGPGSEFTDWASNGDGNAATLQLDLGAVYNLLSVSVTDRVTSGGGNGGFVGGTSDFTTSYSLTAFTDGSFTTAIGGPLVFSKLTPVGPTTLSSFLDVRALNGFTAQYVLYSVVSANGGNTGVSNISFDGTGAVPEPSTWMLLIGGFGMVGFAARRRRTLATA